MVRVRGRGGVLPGDQVRHPLPRLARVQPVEHRAGHRVHRARQHARRTARLLVGAARRRDDRRVHPSSSSADFSSPPASGCWRMAATFWITLAVGIGVLAASGHCMVARWAFAPVCGFDYWRVIVTSPEVLIFLFFMITDPKTVPSVALGSRRVRRSRGRRQHPPHGASDRRVRHQGGAPRRSGSGLRVPSDRRRLLRRRCDQRSGARSPRPASRCRRSSVRLGIFLVVVVALGGAHRRLPGLRLEAASSRRPPTCWAACPTRSTRPRSRRSPSTRTCWTGTTRSPAPGRARSS